MRLRLEFKPADLWIGAYVRREREAAGQPWAYDAWICLLPMLPLHLAWQRKGPARP